MFSVREKYENYRDLIEDYRDASGFIETSHCDSLLFSGLLGCVNGFTVDIEAARGSSGRWYRRPWAWLSSRKCYKSWLPTNKERLIPKLFRMISYKCFLPLVPWEQIVKENWYKGSTISRDMLLGLAWYAWHNKRLDISEDVIKYAMKHWGVMGEGDPARVNIMPSLFATFCWISYKLGGPKRSWARWIPVSNSLQKDYKAHLQVLHILLRRSVVGEISERNAEILKKQAARQPNNPLFAAACGDVSKAVRLLGDPQLWPQERLPTSADRKESWLLQRDYGPDWKPSGKLPIKTHSGADLIFCYALATGDLK